MKSFGKKYGDNVIKSVSARASARKRSSTQRPVSDGDTVDQAVKRQKTISELEGLRRKYEEKAVEYKQLINTKEDKVKE